MSAVNPLQGSGATQLKPPAAAEQRGYEPSMEEILTSIRRIIADDQSLPGRAAPPEEVAPRSHEGHVSTSGEHMAQAPKTSLSPQAIQVPHPVNTVQPARTSDAFTGSPASITMLHQVAQGGRAEMSGSASDADDASFLTDSGRDAGGQQREMLEHGHIAAPQFASPAGPEEPAQDQADTDDHVGSAGAADGEPLHGEDASALVSTETDKSVTSAFNTLAAMRLADNSENLLNLAREMIRPLLRSWLDDNLPAMVERMVRAEIERVARGGR